jgi:ribonuclease J
LTAPAQDDEGGKEKFVPIITVTRVSGVDPDKSRLGDTPYKVEKGDKVIFSAKVIPNPMNVGQRYMVGLTSTWRAPVSSLTST